MLKDVNFDLFNQVAEISKFLSRYDTYMKDSSNCQPCQEAWRMMKDHREEELTMLLQAVKESMDSGSIQPDEESASAQ